MLFGKFFYDRKDKFKNMHLIILIIISVAYIVLDIINRSGAETYLKSWQTISPPLFIYALSVFILGLKIKIPEKFGGILNFLSKGSFFVYLSHLLIFDFVKYLGLSPVEMSGALKFIYPWAVTFGLMAVCYTLYGVLTRIKILNNWIM